MKTVSKALNLLSFFTVGTPEFGLSELSRKSGVDKATTLRLLSSLVEHGLVEQHALTRKYRLGPGLLRLARIREASFPMASIIQPHLDTLTAASGETSHASVAANGILSTIATCDPSRATRVHIAPFEALPYHATASGIAFLAFSAQETVDAILKDLQFAAHTARTDTDAEALRARIAQARADGIAVARGTYDADVVGIAAPILDWSGEATGAIAVAALAARIDTGSEQAIATAVSKASVAINEMLGTVAPPQLVGKARG